MELFYYCLSAPKEESARAPHTHYYVPHQDPILYDDKLEKPADQDQSDDDSEKVPMTYGGLNESLAEVEPEDKEPEVPQIVEPEHDVNLLKRHNSRKFKTPSFKWKKKKKNKVPYSPVPTPSAPDLTVDGSENPVDLTLDDNLDLEDSLRVEENPNEISVDSLNDRLKEKDEEVNASLAQNDADSGRLQNDVDYYKDRLREAEELLNRLKLDNMMLHQRVEMAERDRGALQHGNFVELEKVRDEYQSKLNDLATYPEKLCSAESRFAHAEAQTESLKSQLAEKNKTVEDLNKKIDLFQGQISKLKNKAHAVNEDNIELSNKVQSHERKVMEADLHNKNLMDLVSKKDDVVGQHQPDVDGLPPPPASPSTDNNISEEEKAAAQQRQGSDTETDSSESESEEEVDWSEMLKNAEQNRQRLGLDNVDEGDSTEDEDGNRVPRKKENGVTTQDLMNRMATNQFLGYDEFGRPINGKYHGNAMAGNMMNGKKGAKNRAMLFGMEGKRNTSKGANNRGAGGKKERSGRSGGRRNKKGGGNMALLGF